jgi:hypothetical protein
MSPEKIFPLVDYTVHPAFVPYSPAPITDVDRSIERCFANIDVKLNPPEPLTELTEQEVDRIFDPEIDRELQSIFSLRPKRVSDKPELEALLREVLSDTKLALKKNFMFLRDSKNYKPAVGDARSSQVTSDIQSDGFHLCRLPDRIIEGINELTRDLQKKLFASRTGRMDCTVVLDISGELKRRLLLELAETGIIEGVSGYLGRQVEPMYCALQLSHQDDNWWTDCYADAGVPTAKTVYMHLDHAVMIPKTVIYLCEVKKESGPFRLIKGSHLWKRSAAQVMFFKILDQKWEKIITEKDLQNVPPNYYRKWMWSPKGRNYFASLPCSLRGTSHFGDDILDGSDMANALLADEVSFLSEQGNCITFIGGSAIHRGSQVERGHRINLQLAWVPKPPLVNRLIRYSKRTAASALGMRRHFTFKSSEKTK